MSWPWGAAMIAAIALPLLGGVVAALAPRLTRRLWTGELLILSGASALLSLSLVLPAVRGASPDAFVWQMTPQLQLYLRLDPAGAAFGATVAVLGLLALVYSFGYLRRYLRQPRYYGFLMSCLGLTVGVAYAGNLFTFLVFYEAFSVLTYALVAHEQTRAALAAATKYIGYILVGGSLVLVGVLLTFFLAGDTAFVAGGLLGAEMPRAMLLTTFWCFALGFGVKAALVPLHGWVPDAHPAAPAPFSAVLSGVMVAAGAFGLLRVVHQVFGAELLAGLAVMPWLAGVAGATVIIGALLALAQQDIKRRFAYSTISQMGYLTLAISLLGPGAIVGAMVHLVHHAFMKGTLFFCAGSWRRCMGARRVSQLRGAGRRMPLTAGAFTTASAGLIGLPPMAGFISKWYLGMGMIEVDAVWALAIMLAGALMAAGYLMPIVYVLYFTPVDAEEEEEDGVPFEEEDAEPHAGLHPPEPPAPVEPATCEADATMLVPTLIAAALTLVFGLGSQALGFPVDLATRAAAALLGGP